MTSEDYLKAYQHGIQGACAFMRLASKVTSINDLGHDAELIAGDEIIGKQLSNTAFHFALEIAKRIKKIEKYMI